MSTWTHDVWRACANPGRALHGLQHWERLARYADLSYADVMRYRRELLDDHAFRAHLARCLGEVHYSMPQVIEVYVIVRAVKPRVMLETGVASGISSAHILRALERNGEGALHSIDLPDVQQGSVLPRGRSTGWIVPDSLRARWTLRLGDARTLLPATLKGLERLDVFLHDSDHSYEHMAFEFAQALPRLAPRGLLLSDDAHLHGAWDDFCRKHALRPTRVGNLGVTRKEYDS
jgi:predicted O-methyltransferase YrrM